VSERKVSLFHTFHTKVKCIVGKAFHVRLFFVFVCCKFESKLQGSLEKSKIAQSLKIMLKFSTIVDVNLRVLFLYFENLHFHDLLKSLGAA